MLGFNIGTRNMRAAIAGKNISSQNYRDFKDGLKIISCRLFNLYGESADYDLTPLREDAEIFLDDFCTSCVISINNNILNKNNKNKNLDMARLVRSAGISDFKIISETDAMAAYCEFYKSNVLSTGQAEDLKRFLVIDAGAGAAKLNIIELNTLNYEIIESALVESVSGDKFDLAIAEWLKLLIPDKNKNKNFNMLRREQFNFLLNEAERIKFAISDLNLDEKINWSFGNSEFTIYRDDIERLIKFQIRELAHTVRRLILAHKPEKIFLTGGTANLAILKNILNENLGDILAANKDLLIHVKDDIAALGTAIYAKFKFKSESSAMKNKNALNNYDERIKVINKLKELKLSLIDIEHEMNREQKDRLYMLFQIFQRAENSRFDEAYSQDLIKFYDGLVKDLFKAAANY